MKKIIYLMYILFLSFILSGCINLGQSQLDINKPLDKTKGIIIGEVSEGFLTQPHDLWIAIKSTTPKNDTLILLRTFDSPDEDERKNIYSHKFIYELPEGEYEIHRWRYKYFKGMSTLQKPPIKFTVKANEIAYIGSFHANAISMCLSNNDDYDSKISEFKQKYPILKGKPIVNKAKFLQFRCWKHENAEQ